jgi:hypothetical protein
MRKIIETVCFLKLREIHLKMFPNVFMTSITYKSRFKHHCKQTRNKCKAKILDTKGEVFCVEALERKAALPHCMSTMSRPLSKFQILLKLS